MKNLLQNKKLHLSLHQEKEINLQCKEKTEKKLQTYKN